MGQSATITADSAYWDRRALEGDGDPQAMVGWASHPFEAHENYVYLLLSGLVRSGTRVLDVGCGYGRFAKFVGELNAEWIGVDFSPVMHEIWQCDVEVGTFYLSDARRPQAAWGTFTTILCVGANQTMGLSVDQFCDLYAPLVKRPGNIVLVGPQTTTIRNYF